MQIGAVVNTSFALVQLPVLLLCRVLNRFGIRFDGAAISSRICNPEVMSALDRFLQGQQAGIKKYVRLEFVCCQPQRQR